MKPQPTNADELKATKAIQWLIERAGPLHSWDDDNNRTDIPGSSFFEGTLPYRMIDQVRRDFESAGAEYHDHGRTSTYSVASGETEKD